MPQVQATSPCITPCLWFDGRAEEAARFYTGVFPAARIDEVVRWPLDPPFPGLARAGSVLLVRFTIAGQGFMALDGGPQFKHSEALSLAVRCADQAEVDHYWARLTEGGGEPGQCGWLKDRFGVSWQVVPAVLDALIGSADTARAARVIQALWPMGKLDVAALEAAAAG